MGRQYDVIVFGASGFTGKHVALEVSKSIKAEDKTWAIAGRSEQKLKKVLQELNDEIGTYQIFSISSCTACSYGLCISEETTFKLCILADIIILGATFSVRASWKVNNGLQLITIY